MSETTNVPDVYKKWYRSKNGNGFLSIRPWLDAGKFVVDIGETSDGLKGNTVVFADAFLFATYLHAVSLGRNDVFDQKFSLYGGGRVDNRAVSRILQIEHQAPHFQWKAGHFVAKESDQGAFIPDMRQQLSANSIRVLLPEMAEIAYRVQLVCSAYLTAQGINDGLRALNGDRR